MPDPSGSWNTSNYKRFWGFPFAERWFNMSFSEKSPR